LKKEFNLIEDFKLTEWIYRDGDPKYNPKRLDIENLRGTTIKIDVFNGEELQNVEWRYHPGHKWSKIFGFWDKTVSMQFNFSFNPDAQELIDAIYNLSEKYSNGDKKTTLKIQAQFPYRPPLPPLMYKLLLTTNMPTPEDFLRISQYLIKSEDLKENENAAKEAAADKDPEGGEGNTDDASADKTDADNRPRESWLYIDEYNYLLGGCGGQLSKGTRISLNFTGNGILQQKTVKGTIEEKLRRRLDKELLLGSPIEEILAKDIIGPDRGDTLREIILKKRNRGHTW